MNLLAPLGLAALVAIPVIILFHMRHTTPTRRPVPSLRFWEAANPRPAEARRFQAFEPGGHSGGIPCRQIVVRRQSQDRAGFPVDKLERRHPEPVLVSCQPGRRRVSGHFGVVDNVQHRGLPAARTQIMQGHLQLFRLAGEQIRNEEEETAAGATMGVSPDRWRQRGPAHRLQAL